ncbi:MAG: sensor histidine kinase [Lachnospiraceae bacterium]|nr:sensor histidine kinase [Lachnospiraceae bacterium]
MNKMPRTFQRQLLLYNLLITVCIAAVVSFYNYHSYKSELISTQTRESLDRIEELSENTETAYNDLVNIMLNCMERKTLFSNVTFANYRGGYSDAEASVAAAASLENLCALSGYRSYIYKLTLYNQGYLLQTGAGSSALSDPEQIMDAEWFDELLHRTQGQYQPTLVKNPFSRGSVGTPDLLVIVRPLKSTEQEDVWIFLAISPRLFSDSLNSLPDDSIAYAVTAQGEIISSVNPLEEDISPLVQTLLAQEDGEGSLSVSIQDMDCIVSWKRQPVSGFLCFEILPKSEIRTEFNILLSTVGVTSLCCILVGVFMSVFLSRKLAIPVSKVTNRLWQISQGDFSYDESIEGTDEIGFIGHQINQMSSRISGLLESRVRDEREKKDMEIKMLQAQVNPHFLYNTLDSIKWIAVMQNNTGIVQMTTALSSLLKNMAKGFNEKVTLRQELDFLENYIIIEKIRYIELFDVETVVPEELYEAKIIKLTLQPIVENAIFSGIEPSGRFGLIRIEAAQKEGKLIVTVRDNGVGIEEEKLSTILTDTTRVSGSGMSGIGLPNLDRRFKLVYGEEYGLSIESEPDSYTLVTITAPLEYE